MPRAAATSSYEPPPFDDPEESSLPGSRINRAEGDSSWLAPPPRTWTLRPPPLRPLARTSSNEHSPPALSLSAYCLESIARNIERYDASSFTTVPNRILAAMWDHFDNRFEQEWYAGDQADNKAISWGSDNLFMWLMKQPCQSGAATSASKGRDVRRPDVLSTTQVVSISELVAYLPTTSPLLALQVGSRPDFTLLTTLTLSSYTISDRDLLSLRNLTRLFFLSLTACPRVTDVGVKSLTMSMEYKDIVLAPESNIDTTTPAYDSSGLPEGRGCWRLRGIWLDGCKRITNRAVSDLARWPFLNIISVLNTGVSDPTFPSLSKWSRAIPSDKIFSIPRVASPYHLKSSDPDIRRKIRAYHGRWPNAVGDPKSSQPNFGLIDVVGVDEEDLITFRAGRTIKPRFRSDRPDFGAQGNDLANIASELDVQDRSTAFVTDHGLASWMRPAGTRKRSLHSTGLPSVAINSDTDTDVKLVRDTRNYQGDLDGLFIRPAPTLHTVREELVNMAGILKPRSLVDLQGRPGPSVPRPPTITRPTPNSVISASSSSSATISPFSLGSRPGEITVQRSKGRGKKKSLVSVSYSVPHTQLKIDPSIARDYGWKSSGTGSDPDGLSSADFSSQPSTITPDNKRLALGQARVDEHTLSQAAMREVRDDQLAAEFQAKPRTKGFSMFKRVKR